VSRKQIRHKCKPEGNQKRHEREFGRLDESDSRQERNVLDIEKEVREKLALIPEPKWRKPTYLSQPEPQRDKRS